QIEEIKNRLDIAQVVEKYVPLKQAGKNFSGLCPFHNEKTPSFIVSPDIQRYKCFGCGETGDIFNFVQKIENIDFPEALEKLAKEAGVELKQYKKNPKYSRLEEINYLATKYYYIELRQNTISGDYIKQRGFSQESIKQFGIGYAPRYPKLLEYVKENLVKVTSQELVNSGLFVNKEGKTKEKFYDRIMFPIRSTKGSVIGFTGRIMPGNDYGPKYMNSPDTLIFHKKYNLFAQYESRQEIRKKDLAILCEGSPEVIMAHQYGIKNIVAPLGTGLTKEQLGNISRLTKNILFFFNNDSAGQAAIIRAFNLASELNLYPYATNCAPYKDIDEMLLKEPNLMQQLIEQKQEAFSYIFSNFIKDKDLTKLSDLANTKNFVKELLSHVTDQILHKHYTEKIKQIGKIELTENVSSSTRHKSLPQNTKGFLVKADNNLLGKTYLQLLIFSKNRTKEIFIPSRYLSSPLLQEIYLTIKHSKKTDISGITKLFENSPEKKTFIEEIIFKATEFEEDINTQLVKLIRRLKKQYLTRQQKALSVRIAVAEESNNTEETRRLLPKMLHLTKLLKEVTDD
ncbi:MAG: DNA primase, partial [Candidatus Omnitrophica bacterium]|nr:DNA primase [Candidatus Omnitrophota bacterium]